MTGADSPVIAASFTEAIPSITSPSDGIMSPASTSTTDPGTRSCAAVGTVTLDAGSTISLARVATRVLRSASAAALPRPSATLSAKLANSTVAHNQAAICQAKPTGSPARPSATADTVDSAATTSVARITGLPASWRGSSFQNAPASARRSIAVEKLSRRVGRFGSGAPPPMACASSLINAVPFEGQGRVRISRSASADERQRLKMLDNRAKREGGEKLQPAEDQDDADQQSDEQATVGRQGAC